jgi:hypothetical protein
MIKNILNKEFWKTLVIILLIFLSIMQIFILWSYQSYSLPFHFFRDIFGYGNTNNFIDNIKDKREELLNPKRIIVSDKFEEVYWIFKENDTGYNQLWNEARNYLVDILNFSNLQKDIEVLPKDLWTDVLSEQSVIYELETRFDKNSVRMLLNLPKSNSKIPKGILKIALVPYDKSVIELDNKICMYILDNDYMYKVTLPINEGYNDKRWYDEVLSTCNESEYKKKYEVSGDYFSNSYSNILDISKDVFLYLRDDERKAINSVNISVPDYLYKIDKISNIILGKEINNYVIYSGSDNSIIFQNLDTYYKILESGVLTYKFKHRVEKENKGTESTALEKTLEFLDKCKDITKDSDAKIVLTEIEEYHDSYKFIFSYKIDNMIIAEGEGGQSNLKALEIKANNKKVLECKWTIRNFKVNESKNFYSEYFMTLISNNNFKIYDKKITDIDIVYGGMKNKNGLLKPYWNIKTYDGKYILYNMDEE